MRVINLIWIFFIVGTCSSQQKFRHPTSSSPSPISDASTIEITPQSPEHQSTTLLDVFCAPIVFSDAGFRCFIKHRYNRCEYTDFISLSFNDMIAFLSYAGQHHNREYPKRIINLFHKKLKASSYINAFAFEELIKRMPHLIKQYFEPPQHQASALQQTINTFLYSAFLRDFDNFKQEPEHFLENLSQSITVMTLESMQYTDTTSEQELRSITMRFLEHALNKLIWSPHENEAIWQSVKSIALHLAEFGHQGIFLYEEDLDDLYWSLISRFGYFIDLAGAQISIDAYKKMYQEISEGQLDFLTLDEQEEHVETKQEYISRIIKAGLTKAQAQALGYINEIIVT